MTDNRRMAVSLLERTSGNTAYACIVVLSDGEGAFSIGTSENADIALARLSHVDLAQEQCRVVILPNEMLLENRSPITECSIDGQPFGTVRVGLGPHQLALGNHIFELMLREE